jgi:hypothetical protein
LLLLSLFELWLVHAALWLGLRLASSAYHVPIGEGKMADVPMNFIVAISPKSEGSVVCLLSDLVEKLNSAGVQYLHVGAGISAAYVVLPSNDDLQRLEEAAVSCSATVSGSRYLKLERYGSSGNGFDSVEQALGNWPIDYDIHFSGTRNQMLGVCGLCGGVGRHIGPPCTN